MAIGTDDLIDKFGTQDEVTVASPGSVADGAFSAAGDVNDWTNDDDAPMAIFVLALEDLSAAPSAGLTVGIYCKPLNIADTTGDHQGPNTNVETIHLVDIPVDAVDPAATPDYYSAPYAVRLPNHYTSQVYEFYIKNNLGVSIDSADWKLFITPVSVGPHG